MKKFLFLFVGIICYSSIDTFGQADISMSTHWYNRANYNPATISRPGYIYLFSNVRRQWTGINGSPTVYNFQASGFSEEFNSAFGLSVINDQVGLTSVLNPSLIYAYRVHLKKEVFLSLGLSFGLYSRFINSSAYEAEVVNDPVLVYSDQRATSPDANVGLELQGKYFICGLSTTHLFSIWRANNIFLSTNHQYVYALYKNSDSKLYNFSIGLQVVNRNNLTVVEGTSIFRFKFPTGLVKGPTELFDLGITYRSVKQLTFLTGLSLTPDIRIGYAYDYNFNSGSYKKGTHEIFLEYRIPIKNKKCSVLN
jgi:type IX secretion system PorP/SprF family membrane protein